MTAHPLPFDGKRLLHLDAGADDVKVLDWFIVWLAPALTRPLVPPDRQAVDSVLTVRVDAHAVANWQRTAADQCRDDGLQLRTRVGRVLPGCDVLSQNRFVVSSQ